MLLASSHMLMTCTLTPLLSSPYYADSQVMNGLRRTLAMLPREGGAPGFHPGALLVVLLRLGVAAQLEAESRNLPIRGKIKRQHRMVMRFSQISMLVVCILGHGEDSESPTPIALRNPLTQGEINFSGPTHSKSCGRNSMTPAST
jgi:hypothetical protein